MGANVNASSELASLKEQRVWEVARDEEEEDEGEEEAMRRVLMDEADEDEVVRSWVLARERLWPEVPREGRNREGEGEGERGRIRAGRRGERRGSKWMVLEARRRGRREGGSPNSRSAGCLCNTRVYVHVGRNSSFM